MVLTNAVQPSKLDEVPRRFVWGDLASIALGGRGAHQHYLSRGGFSLWILVGRKLVGPCYTHGCTNPSTDTISLSAWMASENAHWASHLCLLLPHRQIYG